MLFFPPATFKLCDFGLAMPCRGSIEFTGRGTLSHLRLHKESEPVDGRQGDLYAVGVILHIFVWSEPPGGHPDEDSFRAVEFGFTFPGVDYEAYQRDFDSENLRPAIFNDLVESDDASRRSAVMGARRELAATAVDRVLSLELPSRDPIMRALGALTKDLLSEFSCPTAEEAVFKLRRAVGERVLAIDRREAAEAEAADAAEAAEAEAAEAEAAKAAEAEAAATAAAAAAAAAEAATDAPEARAPRAAKENKTSTKRVLRSSSRRALADANRG